MSATTQPTANYYRPLPWIAFLIYLILLSGCAERKLSSPTPQMDVPELFWLRVLLLNDISDCTITAPSPFRVINPQTETTEAHFPALDTPINVNITSGRIVVGGHTIAGTQVILLPDTPFILNINGQEYRGKLKFIINPDSRSFDAINLVPLEPYLAGVVGAEMPAYWEPAALQAQAVAARTYCLYIKQYLATRRKWDVSATQSHQVYLGLKAESPQIWHAVNSTSGEVLVHKPADGTKQIFPAYYSSICGGHTENSKNVFGGDFYEPLAGVPCPYCKDVAKPSLLSWPVVQFNKTDVTASLLKRYPKLKQLGRIKGIIPVKQSNHQDFLRLTLVKLLGSTGKSDFLRAEDLRLTIDPTGRRIKSTACQIMSAGDKWTFFAGRGYGHGVGMCQCGAQEMARLGKTAKQILFYYYPGSKISRVY